MGNAWKGAAVLTAAALVTKLLSALYRIPYQNMVGDIGFYIYQQIYPIYGIVVALSLTGYPVAVSRLIAERRAVPDAAGAAAVGRAALFVLGAIGAALFALLYIGAETVALWMGDRRLEPLLRQLSFSFLLFPPLAWLRGYFQGRHDMAPTAMSQVVEQSVRVTAILGLSYWVLRRGGDDYACGMAAIAGTLAGMVAALFVLLCFLVQRRPQGWREPAPPALTRRFARHLLTAGSLVCLTNMALTLIPLVDSFLFVPLLKEAGTKLNEGQWLKGVYDRGQPLIQLGTVVGTSFSLALVPLISGARRPDDATAHGALAIRIAAVIGAGASLGLVCLIRPINQMLFENTHGSLLLAVLSASVFFTTIALTASALLQGIGRERIAAVGVAIGVAGKMALMHWFVPLWGALGAAAATTGAYALMAAFLYAALPREYRAAGYRCAFPIVKAAAVMVIVLRGYLWVLTSAFGGRLWAAVAALGGSAIGAAVYVACIVKSRAFSEREWSTLPFVSSFRLRIGGK
ncbi:putative polysaccharide biosynthesis protein [Geobacillus sp. YF-1]|uniref:putative polysaccharide biosynthesis protein n=1 Tax=Geobacillus sp. YF-1 TaxID=3457480 RepID=UPI004045B826